MLTDTACRNATCPEERARLRLADSGGLYLEVTPNESKRWFVKYRFGGKERRLALGRYPEVTLKAAREGRDKARKDREAGSDPVQARRLGKITSASAAAATFEQLRAEQAARDGDGIPPGPRIGLDASRHMAQL